MYNYHFVVLDSEAHAIEVVQVVHYAFDCIFELPPVIETQLMGLVGVFQVAQHMAARSIDKAPVNV